MAKQNVTYIERHVEKIAAGTGGAVLLFVLVTNVLMNPNAAQVGGESVGPSQLYDRLVEQADAARRQIDGASDVPADIAGKSEQLHTLLVLTAKPPPKELPVAATPLRPALPEVTGGIVAPVGAKVRLAEILPPTQPVLSTGKAFARLMMPRDQQPGGAADGSAAADLMPTTELHWVAGAAVIDRKAQREKFAAAKYLSDRQELIVAEMRVERREQMPNGQWADPVVVQPYASRRIVARARLNTLLEGTDLRVRGDESQYASDLRQLLHVADAQTAILRPEFQSYLADPNPSDDDTTEWQIPRTLTAPGGATIDMTSPDFGVQFVQQDERAPGVRPTGKPGTARPTDGEAAGPPAARVQRAVKQAEEAIAQKKWLEAKQILDDLIAATDVNEILKRDALNLRKRHLTDFEEAERRASRMDSTQSQDRLGPDDDPLWFTDISVQPGKTYQYRLSVVAYNEYVDSSSRLENPNDVGKLLLQGQWSEWSKAVTVPAAKHLFLTSVPPDGGRVSVELWEWKAGEWLKARADLLPGEVVAAARNPKDTIDYGAVLVSADPLRPFVRRSGSPKSETFKYEPQETGAAVVVNAEGQIEEHFVAESADRRLEVNRTITEERKRREALKTQGNQVAPVRDQLTPRAPRDRGDPERDRPRRYEREERGGSGRR